MLGIPCEDPTFVYSDNKTMLANTTVPAPTLKKKADSLSFHFVREGCTHDKWRTTYAHTYLNLADMFTKPLPSGGERWGFFDATFEDRLHRVPQQRANPLGK